MHADFSASGVPAADFARDELVELVRVPLSSWSDGNQSALTEATARSESEQAGR